MNEVKGLQETFFNLLATTFEEENWQDTVCQKIIKQTSEFLDADYVALYMRYDKTGSYQLVDAISKIKNLQPMISISHSEVLTTSDFFEVGGHTKYEKLIPLELTTNDVLVFIIVKDQPLTDEITKHIKTELEKLLSIVYTMWRNLARNRNNKFLLDVSTKLLKANDKSYILQEIVAALERQYPDYEYYLLMTQEHEANLGLPLKIMEYTDENIHDISTQVFMTGELKIDVDKEKKKKIVFAPMIGEQSVYGVLELITPMDKYYSNQELEFIKEFAILAGKALENTILYEDSLLQVTNLTLLNEVIHELNASSELIEIISHIRNKIISISEATQIGFVYFDEESDDAFNVLNGSTSFFKETRGNDLIQFLKHKMDTNLEPIFSGNNLELDHYGFQSVMVIPMVYSGLSLGFAVILHEEQYHFTFEDFKLIESLIQHSSVAISNTMLKEKLQATVITDFLTQLYSRRYLEDKMKEHIIDGETGSLVLFDIDDFKKINDHYGHHVGDKVLKQVAQLIDEIIGDFGIPARWGGEELAVYLPEQTIDKAKQLSEEIREVIAMETEPTITVSCGIASWHSGEEVTQESLFLKADHALYRAKSNGKNCVVTTQ